MNTSSFISQRLTPSYCFRCFSDRTLWFYPSSWFICLACRCQYSHHTILQSVLLITMQFVSFTPSLLSHGWTRRFRIHFKAWHSLSLFSFPTESKVKPEDHTWYYISVISALQAPCARTLQRVHPLEFIWSCIPYDWWTRSPNGNDQQELAGVTLGPRP